MATQDLLASLEPRTAQKVISLLQQAGVDASDWKNYSGRSPAANPKYCYNWSFAYQNKLVAVCIWHSSIKIEDDMLVCLLKSRSPTGLSPRSEAIWKRRSDALLDDLDLAYQKKLPVRAIILEGDEFDKYENPKASKVRRRLLDTTPWAVVEHEPATREFLLVRGADPKDIIVAPSDPVLSSYEGQERWLFVKHRRREGRFRNAKIQEALKRDGKLTCQVPRCGFDFQNRYGAIGESFAEVHHLDPLNTAPKEGREVKLDRLVVVCSNCHSMIHVGGQCRDIAALIPAAF